jgi:fatty acid synthase
MDSMTAVQLKQSLEREFGLFLTPKQIRSLTFARLKEMAENWEEARISQGTHLLLLSGNYF